MFYSILLHFVVVFYNNYCILFCPIPQLHFVPLFVRLYCIIVLSLLSHFLCSSLTCSDRFHFISFFYPISIAYCVIIFYHILLHSIPFCSTLRQVGLVTILTASVNLIIMLFVSYRIMNHCLLIQQENVLSLIS